MRPTIEMPPPMPPRGNGGMSNSVIAGIVGGVLAVGIVLAAIALFGARVSGRANALGASTIGNPAQRRAALSLVQTVQAQTSLYRLQHNDDYPDFAAYPNWDQLMGVTDVNGKPVADQRATPGSMRYGPYLHSKPVNPLNRLTTVAVVRSPLAPGDAVPGGTAVGFVFCTADGRFHVTDVAGTRVIDPRASKPPAPATAPGSGDSAVEQASPVRDPSAAAMRSTLLSAKAQIKMFQLQHNMQPDFVRYPNWQQFTTKTNEQGMPSPTGPLGPYFQRAPINPYTGRIRVQVVNEAPREGFVSTVPGAGWVFNAITGDLYGLDAGGRIVPQP
jgi:hypothetical protein